MFHMTLTTLSHYHKTINLAMLSVNIITMFWESNGDNEADRLCINSETKVLVHPTTLNTMSRIL